MAKVTEGKDTAAKQIKDDVDQGAGPVGGRRRSRSSRWRRTRAGRAPTVNGAAAMPRPAPAEQGTSPAARRTSMRRWTKRRSPRSISSQVERAADAGSGWREEAGGGARRHRAGTDPRQGGGRRCSRRAGRGKRRLRTAGLSAMSHGQGRGAEAGRRRTRRTPSARRRSSGRGSPAAINRIYDATKTDVEAILAGLDGKVAEDFDAGASAGTAAFTAEHRAGWRSTRTGATRA